METKGLGGEAARLGISCCVNQRMIVDFELFSKNSITLLEIIYFYKIIYNLFFHFYSSY